MPRFDAIDGKGDAVEFAGAGRPNKSTENAATHRRAADDGDGGCG
jgi:hypothetical protein